MDRIIDRLRLLDDAEVAIAIDEGRRRAKRRHSDIESTWIANGRLACDMSIDSCSDLDRARLLLLGMAFTLEYAVEAAALTNPSMVALGELTPNGDQQIVMSARAIGEGHISSIAFPRRARFRRWQCAVRSPHSMGRQWRPVASGRSTGRNSALD